MEKIRAEVEDLMEEILDDEAETGEANPLAARFVKILTCVQEDNAEKALKEARDKLKERLCRLVDICPELKIDTQNLASLEQMAARGNHYKGILSVAQLVRGEEALNARVERDGDLAADALQARGMNYDQIEAEMDAFPVFGEVVMPAPAGMPAGMWNPAPAAAIRPRNQGVRVNEEQARQLRQDAMRNILREQAGDVGGVLFNPGNGD